MIKDIGYLAIIICLAEHYFKFYSMKNILFITLILAFIIEAVLSFLCFFMPAKAMELFGMQYNEQFAFLGYIIAWFLLLVTILIGYAMYLLQINKAGSRAIINILGFWWIGLGIGVYTVFDKLDNLLLDSLKGMVILGLNYFYNKDGAEN
jgi:DMSO/TMAO reductase YedYZ heme-binding membrane subunit